MRAGNLREVVTIQQFTSTVNEYGDLVKSWTTFATIRAEVLPTLGQEAVMSKQVYSGQMVRIRARYLPGVTPKMRVLHGSDVLDIRSVANITSAGRVMELVCEINNAST